MKDNEMISGDYQYRALYNGPLCQRRWHVAKLRLLERMVAGQHYQRICDVGCGSGIVAQHVAQFCPDATVIGIDFHGEAIDFARQQYAHQDNLSFSTNDILALRDADLGTFDFVYATEVIEHFKASDIRRVLNNMMLLGNRDTKYLLTTPDYHSMWPWLEYALDVLRLTPQMSKRQHLYKFNELTLMSTLVDAGFHVLDMFNFCGISSFFANLSGRFSDYWAEREERQREGFLICCLFQIAPIEKGMVGNDV